MQPVPNEQPDESVRPVAEGDLDAVDELSRIIYRVSRRNEVASGITGPSRAFVRERGDRVVGYFSLGMIGHGVAQTEDDLLALVRDAARLMPPDFSSRPLPANGGRPVP